MIDEQRIAEIVKTLRNAAGWFGKHGRNTNTAIIEIAKESADLIEYLQTQLAESRRRELATVDLMDGIESCLICMPGGAGCSDYGGKSCYRWKRGSQEAGDRP